MKNSRFTIAIGFILFGIWAFWMWTDSSWLQVVNLRARGRAVEGVVRSKALASGATGQIAGQKISQARVVLADGRSFEVDVEPEAWARLMPGQDVSLLIDAGGERAILRDAPSGSVRRAALALGAAAAAIWVLRRLLARGR